MIRHFLSAHPLRILASMLIAVVLCSAADAAVVYQTRVDGASGSMSYNAPDRSAMAVLSVGRDSGSGTTSVFFVLEFYSGGNYTETFGYGFIPNGDLQGEGTGSLVLNTDTSTNPNFTVNSCTTNLGTGNYSCGNIPGGVLSVNWKDNHQFRQHTTGTSEFTYLTFKQHEEGTSDTRGASAEGSLLGVSFSTAWGNIGSTRGGTVRIERGN